MIIELFFSSSNVYSSQSFEKNVVSEGKEVGGGGGGGGGLGVMTLLNSL